MPKPSRKKIYALAAFALGIASAFILAEVILQIFHPFQFSVRGDEIVLTANRVLEIGNSSNPKLDSKIVHSQNSLGFRGQEPPANWGESTTVITVGGSTTQCYYLSDDKTWQSEVDRLASAACDGFWINNAGLDGHSTFGHQVLLRDYITKLKPDYVLFLVGINDIGRADRSRFDATMQNSEARSAAGRAKALAKRSELLSLCRNLYRYHQARKKGVTHQQVDVSQLPTVQISQTQKADLLAQHRNMFLAGYQLRLERLVQTCKAGEITPVLMTQPLLVGFGVDKDSGADLAAVEYDNTNGDVGWAVLELYNDILRDVAQEQEVELIDLAALLEKRSRYFYDFTHYTNEGAKRVGELVAERLASIIQADGKPK